MCYNIVMSTVIYLRKNLCVNTFFKGAYPTLGGWTWLIGSQWDSEETNWLLL